MAIGSRVAQLRAVFGESLREAAMRTQVSHTTIARIENGQVRAHLNDTLKRIADGYGVSMEWLLTGRESRGDRDSQIQVQALAAGVGKYIQAIQQAAASGVSPGDVERLVRIVAKANREGLQLELVELAVDLAAAKLNTSLIRRRD